jgi:hypothetical protein
VLLYEIAPYIQGSSSMFVAPRSNNNKIVLDYSTYRFFVPPETKLLEFALWLPTFFVLSLCEESLAATWSAHLVGCHFPVASKRNTQNWHMQSCG